MPEVENPIVRGVIGARAKKKNLSRIGSEESGECDETTPGQLFYYSCSRIGLPLIIGAMHEEKHYN